MRVVEAMNTYGLCKVTGLVPATVLEKHLESGERGRGFNPRARVLQHPPSLQYLLKPDPVLRFHSNYVFLPPLRLECGMCSRTLLWRSVAPFSVTGSSSNTSAASCWVPFGILADAPRRTSTSTAHVHTRTPHASASVSTDAFQDGTDRAKRSQTFIQGTPGRWHRIKFKAEDRAYLDYTESFWTALVNGFFAAGRYPP